MISLSVEQKWGAMFDCDSDGNPRPQPRGGGGGSWKQARGPEAVGKRRSHCHLPFGPGRRQVLVMLWKDVLTFPSDLTFPMSCSLGAGDSANARVLVGQGPYKSETA